MKSIVRAGFRAAISGFLVLAAGSASAHHVWLEVDANGAKLYFGEFGENLREASPGTLDKVVPQARAVAPAGARPLTAEKSPNAYVLGGRIDANDSVVAEDVRYPAFERKRDNKKGIYVPAARFVPDRTARTPVLTLDIVPMGGDRFQVSYKGKPLAKAKVEVITPSGWGREVQSGENGEFEVALPWRGTYVLEVHHNDNEPGKRGEEAYDFANYVTSLTVVKPQGIEPLPAPPPAKSY